MKKIPQLRFTCAKAEDREKTLDIDVFSVVGTDWEGDESSAAATRRAIKNADVDLIRLNINSPGGFTDDAVAIYQQLVDHPARVEGMIYNAASAATVIAMACDTIRMAEFGKWMIHEASACACGDAAFFKHIAERLDTTSGQIASLYSKRTGRDAGEIRKMMKAETWLTAEKAAELGFVDEVVEGKTKEDDVRIAACFTPDALEQFSNVPSDLQALVGKAPKRRPMTAPRSSTTALLMGAMTPRPAEPTPAEPTPTTPEGDSPSATQPQEQDMRTIALALGLPETATEAQIVKTINDRANDGARELSQTQTQFEAVNADRTRLLAAAEAETVDAAIGAIEAGKTAKTELKAAQDRLDAQQKEAEGKERDQIVAQLWANGEKGKCRITPAQRDGFCKTASLETLKAFANDAPVVMTGSAAVEPETTTASTTNQAVTHDGKAYENMTGPERIALKKSDPDTFNALRSDWYARSCPTAASAA